MKASIYSKEKQGEQILANSAKTCKIELKFKAGDWVVSKYGYVWHVDSFDKNYCQVSNGEGDDCYFEISKQDDFHLWTIEDAKDGDVLQLGKVTAIFKKYIDDEECICYCAYCKGERFEIPIADGYNNVYGCDNAHPATKEQRDTLFAKMKDEGYEWNAVKKELKRIEQSNEENYEIDGLFYAKTILEKTLGKVEGYQTDDGILEHKSAITAVEKLCEQNTTWSKEDVNMCEAVIDVLVNNTMSGSEGREVYSEEIEWLKSLKETIEKRNEYGK